MSQLTFSCQHLEKNDDGTPLADLSLEAKSSPTEIDRYGGRRALERIDCDEVVSGWKRVTKGEKYACISGIGPLEEQKAENGVKTLVREWTFDRLKTRRGCMSYFDGYCTAGYWNQRGNR